MYEGRVACSALYPYVCICVICDMRVCGAVSDIHSYLVSLVSQRWEVYGCYGRCYYIVFYPSCLLLLHYRCGLGNLDRVRARAGWDLILFLVRLIQCKVCVEGGIGWSSVSLLLRHI